MTNKLAKNLNDNLMLDHLDYVDHGVIPVDEDYIKFKRKFMEEWGKEKYHQESLLREALVEELYGTDWANKRINVDAYGKNKKLKSQKKYTLAKRASTALKENPFGFAALAVIVLFIGCWAYKAFLGPKRPGAFLERTNYETVINVLVYPDRNTTKNYYLPGDVTKSGDIYTVSAVKWSNGGYSTFEDCQIKLKKRTNCTITNTKKYGNFLNKDGEPSIDEILSLPSYSIQLTNKTAIRK